jgi:hypothetical protein
MSIFDDRPKKRFYSDVARTAKIRLLNVPTEAREVYGRASVKAHEIHEKAKEEFSAPKLKPFHGHKTIVGFGWTNTQRKRRW